MRAGLCGWRETICILGGVGTHVIRQSGRDDVHGRISAGSGGGFFISEVLRRVSLVRGWSSRVLGSVVRVRVLHVGVMIQVASVGRAGAVAVARGRGDHGGRSEACRHFGHAAWRLIRLVRETARRLVCLSVVDG